MNRVGTQVLGPDSKGMQYVPEKLRARGMKASVEVVSKYDNLVLSRLGMNFFFRGPPVDFFLWRK